jgi:hypothetical protein
MLVLFFQEPTTEKKTGNVASAQNGCGRTTLTRQFKYAKNARNNHNTDKFCSHFCSKLYFLVLKMLGISFYTVASEMKNFNKIKFLSLIESIKNSEKTC